MCIYKNAHAKLTKMQTELFTNDITGSWLLVSCITAISTKETTYFTEKSFRHPLSTLIFDKPIRLRPLMCFVVTRHITYAWQHYNWSI